MQKGLEGEETTWKLQNNLQTKGVIELIIDKEKFIAFLETPEVQNILNSPDVVLFELNTEEKDLLAQELLRALKSRHDSYFGQPVSAKLLRSIHVDNICFDPIFKFFQNQLEKNKDLYCTRIRDYIYAKTILIGCPVRTTPDEETIILFHIFMEALERLGTIHDRFPSAFNSRLLKKSVIN